MPCRCFVRLVGEALEAYGDVGVYDPAQLAKIDFLNQPKLLVDLVCAAKPSASISVRLPKGQRIIDLSAAMLLACMLCCS